MKRDTEPWQLLVMDHLNLDLVYVRLSHKISFCVFPPCVLIFLFQRKECRGSQDIRLMNGLGVLKALLVFAESLQIMVNEW